MNEYEFEKTLIEVRKSYRLIYLYQRRVLDLINFIGSKLALNFHSGWSKFSNPAKINTRAKLTYWSWDWLMLYFYEFHFGIVRDEIKFSIILQSDSGFFESDSKDKLDISKFLSSEKSSTKLYFVLGKGVWGCPIENFLKEHFKSEETEFRKEISNDKFWLAKSYNLTGFLNEKSTIKIINDFLKYSESNGIKMNEEKNEVQQSI